MQAGKRVASAACAQFFFGSGSLEHGVVCDGRDG